VATDCRSRSHPALSRLRTARRKAASSAAYRSYEAAESGRDVRRRSVRRASAPRALRASFWQGRVQNKVQLFALRRRPVPSRVALGERLRASARRRATGGAEAADLSSLPVASVRPTAAAAALRGHPAERESAGERAAVTGQTGTLGRSARQPLASLITAPGCRHRRSYTGNASADSATDSERCCCKSRHSVH